MTDRFRRVWNHPYMMRWGRLALLLIAVIPIFFFFYRTDARNDGLILISISTALWIGIMAAMMTTERYPARSLGLFAMIMGAAVYFTFLYLIYAKDENHMWMADLTRAFFVVGSPLFAISTVVALVQRTHARSTEHHQDLTAKASEGEII